MIREEVKQDDTSEGGSRTGSEVDFDANDLDKRTSRTLRDWGVTNFLFVS